MRPVKHAFRRLRKSPGYTVVAALTLALGVGFNVAVFSILDGFLLRTLPYPEPDRIAALVVHREQANPKGGETLSEEDDSFDGSSWQLIQSSLDGATIASWGGTSGVNLRAGTAVRYLTGSRVSARYFDVLGLRLFLGRSFSEKEDRPNGPPLAVISYGLWASAFRSDPGIVGQSIQLKGEPYTVVGVLPRGALTPSKADVFTPLRPAPTGECGGNNCGILIRLNPRATWAQVNAQLERVRLPYFSELETRYHGRARIYARPLQLELAGEMRDRVMVLMLAVSLILLIACANLAGLALVRTLRRSHEIATRLALGASKLNVVRDLWMEDILVSLLGGAAGVGVALLILKSLPAILPEPMIPVGGFSLDARVLAFALAVSVAAGLLFGALPALQAGRFELRASGGRSVTSGSSRIRQILVGAEIALTLVLLAGAGLLVRTLVYLEMLPPGFDAHDVMTATASLDDARYRDPATFEQLLAKSIAAVRQIPGVTDAAVGLSLPYERGLNDRITILDGKTEGTRTGSSVTYVTPGYFSTLRIPLLAGRPISDADTATSEHVAVANAAFSRRFFGGASPLGFHFKIENTSYTLVGVVGDVAKKPGLEGSAPIATEPVIYLPAAQTPKAILNMAHIWFQPSWVVRMEGPIAGLPALMQRALAEADAGLPFSGFRSMKQVLAEQLQDQRIEVVLLGSLAGLALLLAAIGIYALVSNLVEQRTREIGIRIALGSTMAQAMLHVGTPGIAAAAGGLVAGTGLALFATGVLSSQIYGVRAQDPVTFVAVAVLLAITAAIASFIPTLRISRMEPSVTLRSE